MGRLQQLYDKALADLASGRTDPAGAALRTAAVELAAIATASGKATAVGRPRDARGTQVIQGAEDREEALRSARQRLTSLRDAVALEIRRAEKARKQLRDRRRLRAIFGEPVAAEGTWLDRSG